MKILFTGGVKSGKSSIAEKRTLQISKEKLPIYLATTELFDPEMKKRVAEHRKRRGEKFKIIEESLYLSKIIRKEKGVVLIECLTMWLNNALHSRFSEEKIFVEINNLLALENDIIFVQNEVGMGIVPVNSLAREFIDLSGKISQILAESCDEVNLCVAGLLVKLK